MRAAFGLPPSEDANRVLASDMGNPRIPILLIEDDPHMAEEIVLELGKADYDVKTVASTEAGFAALREHPAALMIMDRLLHGQDSLPMIETLRDQGVMVPVLLISSLAAVDELVCPDSDQPKPADPVGFARSRALQDPGQLGRIGEVAGARCENRRS